jgi:hypothetical protein
MILVSMKYAPFAYLLFYSYKNENPTNYHSERSLNFKDVGHKYFTSHFPQKITSAMEEDILILDYRYCIDSNHSISQQKTLCMV